MLFQLNPPIPVITPKGKAICVGWVDYGIEFDLLWICFQDLTGECWTWKNPDIRAQFNITHGREHINPFNGVTANHFTGNFIKKDSEPVRQQDSEPVRQQDSKTVSQKETYKYDFQKVIKPNPNIPWNSWSDYLPDEGKFYFNTRKAGGVFMGQRHTNHLNIMEIKLDARYRMEDHGMIVGWKPYD